MKGKTWAIRALALVLALCLCAPAVADTLSAEKQAVPKTGLEAKGKKVWFDGLPQTMFVGTRYPINVATSTYASRCKVWSSKYKVIDLDQPVSGGTIYAVPLKQGTAKIAASIRVGKKTYKVTQKIKVLPSVVTAISLPDAVTVEQGDTYQFTPAITPAGLNPSLTWHSSTPDVAAVSQDGLLEAYAPGEATILVRAESGVSATCRVTVTGAVTANKRRFYGFGMSKKTSLVTPLPSIEQELPSVTNMFKRLTFEGRKLADCVYRLNYTKSSLLADMRQRLSSAKEGDTTYVYYTGHGGIDEGLLCISAGTDDLVSAAELKEILDNVPGKIVLFINACESGSVIGKGSGAQAFARRFVSQFLSAGVTAKSNEFVNGKYTVYCAAKSDESAWISDGEDFFASSLCSGLGWNLMRASETGAWKADASGDGQVTVNELYNYLYKTVNAFMAAKPDLSAYTQTVVCYPQTSAEVLFVK